MKALYSGFRVKNTHSLLIKSATTSYHISQLMKTTF